MRAFAPLICFLLAFALVTNGPEARNLAGISPQKEELLTNEDSESKTVNRRTPAVSRPGGPYTVPSISPKTLRTAPSANRKRPSNPYTGGHGKIPHPPVTPNTGHGKTPTCTSKGGAYGDCRAHKGGYDNRRGGSSKDRRGGAPPKVAPPAHHGAERAT